MDASSDILLSIYMLVRTTEIPLPSIVLLKCSDISIEKKSIKYLDNNNEESVQPIHDEFLLVLLESLLNRYQVEDDSLLFLK